MGNRTDAGRYINQISNRLKRHSHKVQKNLGLTTAQENILRYILLEGQEGNLYQKDVEREFDLRPSTATELLRTLEKKGLICRVSDEHDARYKVLRVTPKAAEMKEAVEEEIDELESTLTKGISRRDLEIFKKTAEKMLENLSEHQ